MFAEQLLFCFLLKKISIPSSNKHIALDILLEVIFCSLEISIKRSQSSSSFKIFKFSFLFFIGEFLGVQG